MSFNRPTYDQLVKARDEGKLTTAADFVKNAPLFVENERIVDPRTKSAEQFQEYMQEFTDLLLRDDKWKPKAPVHFFLSLSEEKNAYVIPDKNVNIMVFTKGMLKFLKNKDELGYILGHELGHIHTYDTLATAHVTKGEEAISDIIQIPWLHQAKLNPQAGVNVMSRFWKIEERESGGYIPEVLIALLDEHPNTSLRPMYINNAIQAYARVKGITAGFDPAEDAAFAFTPKDKQLGELMKGARECNYFAELAYNENYNKKSPVEQLEFIRDHLADVPRGYLPYTRPAGVKQLLEACDCDYRDGAVQRLGGEIIDKLLQNSVAFNICYNTVINNTLNKKSRTPVGVMSELEHIVQGVVTAKDKTGFQQNSHRLLDFIKAHPGFKPSVVDIVGFELPSPQRIHAASAHNKTLPLPWNQHLKWAEELCEEGDAEPQMALFHLGVEDFRLYQQMTYENLQKLDYLYALVINNDNNYKTRQTAHFIPVTNANQAKLVVDMKKGEITATNELLSRGEYGTFAYPLARIVRAKDNKAAAQCIKTASLLTGKKLDGEPASLTPDAFREWFEKNLPLLYIPLFPVTSSEKIQLLDQIYNTIAPLHRQLTDILKKMAAGDEDCRKFVRHFFLDEGQDTLGALISENPEIYQAHYVDKSIKKGFIQNFIVKHRGDLPETELVFEDESNIFTIEEKARYYSERCQDAAGVQVQRFLKMGKCRTREDTIRNLELLQNAHEMDVDSICDVAIEQLDTLQRQCGSDSEFITTAIQKCPGIVDKFQTDYESSVKSSTIDADLSINTPSTKALEDQYLIPKYVRDERKTKKIYAYGNMLNDKIASVVNDNKQWPEDYMQLVDLYKHAEKKHLIKHPKVYKAFANKLQQGLYALTDNRLKQEFSEALLKGSTINNPELRKLAVEKWVEGVAQQLRDRQLPEVDDKSPAFVDFIMEQARGLKRKVPSTLGREMLALLAEKVEAQRALSYAVENIFSLTAEALQSGDPMIRAFEGTMYYFATGRSKRKKMISFLSTPLTAQSLEAFGYVLREECKEMTMMMQVNQHVGKHSDLSDDDGPYADLVGGQYDVLDKEQEDYYRMKAAELYENYWNFPLAARGMMMDYLMVPPSKRYYADTSVDAEEVKEELQADVNLRHRRNISQDQERDAYNMVVERVLPADMKYADQAREFISLYSKVIPQGQKMLMLAAMMTVERAAEGKDEKQFGIGKRLSMILDMMGPAERKLGQGLNSHPSVPVDLRYDARELKFKASPLARWDAWHEIDRTVHPDYLGQIQHLGKSLGSASFYVTYESERPDGSKGAIRMLRNNAIPQAKEGFRLLRKFVDSYKTKHTDASEMCEVMDDLIEQARGMAYTETNSTIGVAQMQHAQKLYNGYNITVDGHTFHFKNANWRAYGPEFMDQEYQPGTHFIQLPGDEAAKQGLDKDTQKDFAYKKAAAKAYVTMEFINILSGQGFDHDRHGAQLRIQRLDNKNSAIGLFDNGAIHAEVRKKDKTLAQPYLPGCDQADDYKAVLAAGGKVVIAPPTKPEKILLAKTLFKAVQDYLNPDSKRPIADTLYDEVKRIRSETGSTPDYLLRVQRALLSLNDFFGFEKTNGHGAGQATQARYVNDKDIADIITGIVQARDPQGNELIDAEIKKAIFGGVGTKLKFLGSKLMGGGLAEELKRFQSDTPVAISRDKELKYDVPTYYEAPPTVPSQGAPSSPPPASAKKAKIPKWAKDTPVSPAGLFGNTAINRPSI